MRDRFDIVVACDLNRGIGKDNSLPWRLPRDLKHFKQLTTTSQPNLYNAVIMGRKTWESIPSNVRPLPQRYNVVLTRDTTYQLPQGVFRCQTFEEAFATLAHGPVDNVFVIGGAQTYNMALQDLRVGFLYLTEIRHTFECDTFFPDYKPFFQMVSCSEIQEENGLEFCFKVYKPNLLA
ncbi:MAG: dihydrofolate reductase [Cyanobacteria bacterium]|nr:dihydrofolate reductase [Cyanobacteriota bacterium]